MGGFSFQIDTDATPAVRKVRDLVTQLHTVENVARQTGVVLRGAVSLPAGPIRQTTSALADMNVQLQREARILESIRGPMREYESDLRAVNALMARGAITAAEYAAALQQVRARSGGGAVSSTINSRTGAVATQRSGGIESAIGAAQMAAASLGAAAAAKSVIDFADANTTLTNKLENLVQVARRNNRETLTSKQLYDELHEVAQSTRQDIDATTTAFVGLSNATSRLGISQQQTIRLTETVNKLVVASGADGQAAAAGLRQLGQALASGRLQGDEFRSISENLPALRDALADSLGVGIAKLKEMSSEGKLTSQVVVEALSKVGKSADSAFAAMKMTYTDRLTQLKNFATKYAPDFIDGANGTALAQNLIKQKIEDDQQIISNGQRATAVARETGAELTRLIDTFSGLRAVQVTSAVMDFNASLNDLTKSLVNVEAQVRRQEYRAQLALAQNNVNVTNQQLSQSIPGFSDARLSAMGLIPEAQLRQDKIRNEFALKRLQTPGAADALDYQEKVASLKAKIGDLRSELANGTVDVDSFTYANKMLEKQLKSLTGEEGGGGINYYARMFEAVLGPQRDFIGSTRALDQLLKEGMITLAQYREQAQKLAETFDTSGFAKLLNNMNPNIQSISHGAMVATAERQLREQYGEPDQGQPFNSRRVVDGEESDLAHELTGSPDEIAKATDRVKQWRSQLQSALDEINAPMNQVAEKQRILFQLWTDGAITLEQYEKGVLAAADALIKYNEEQDASGANGFAAKLGSDVKGGLEAVRDQALDTASAMRTAMLGAFSSIEDGLVQLVTSGEVNWKQMVESMLSDLTRLLFRQAVSGGLMAALGGGGGIPAFATGGSFVVGGNGGTDTTLVAFRATPGERVTVENPAQSMNPTSRGGGGAAARRSGTTVVNNFDHDYVRAAIDSPDGERLIMNIVERNSRHRGSATRS